MCACARASQAHSVLLRIVVGFGCSFLFIPPRAPVVSPTPTLPRVPFVPTPGVRHFSSSFPRSSYISSWQQCFIRLPTEPLGRSSHPNGLNLQKLSCYLQLPWPFVPFYRESLGVCCFLCARLLFLLNVMLQRILIYCICRGGEGGRVFRARRFPFPRRLPSFSPVLLCSTSCVLFSSLMLRLP